MHLATALASSVPFVASFSDRDYDAHVQNWAAVQDHDGIVYFGNNDGVLSFDGERWQLTPVDNQSIVRSLAVDAEGVVWVGAVGELGYLERQNTGKMRYVSLLRELPADHGELADIWRCFATPNGVYFWTRSELFRWHQGRFETLECRSARLPSMVDGAVYNNHPEHGLQQLRDNRFTAVPGGADTRGLDVVAVIKLGEQTLLVGTRDRGLFRLDIGAPGTRGADAGARLTPLPTEVDELLREHKLYHAVRTDDGTLVLGTMTGGAAVISSEGASIVTLDHSSGLPDLSVWYCMMDRDGGLWLALNRGLARVELSSNLARAGPLGSLDGTVETILRFDGVLHVGTSTGLYRQTRHGYDLVPGLQAPCWDLVSFSTSAATMLLAGCYDGVFQIAQNAATRIATVQNAFTLATLPSFPELMAVGHGSGLALVRFNGSFGQDLGSLPEIETEIRSIAEGPDGTIWLGTGYDGLRRFELVLEPEPHAAELRALGREHGVPSLRSPKLHAIADTLLVSTPGGVRQLGPEGMYLVPTDILGPELMKGNLGINRIVPDPAGDLWLSPDGHQPILARRQADGHFEIEDAGLRRLPRVDVMDILPEADGTVWIGTPRGLFVLDRNRHGSTARHPTVLLREVATATGELLSLIPSAAAPSGHSWRAAEPLAAVQNSLGFHFATPSFDDISANRYSYRLDGFDRQWSPWSRDTKKEYTNLAPARYQFRVRARDVHGHVSPEAVYRFRILPPWHQSAWARGAALILCLTAVWGLVRWRSHTLLRQRDQLERQVATRTAELESSRNQLETVRRIVAAINSETEFEELTLAILEQLHIIPAVESACILAHDHSTRRLRLQAASGPGRRIFAEMERPLQEFRERFLDRADEVAPQVYLSRPHGALNPEDVQHGAELEIWSAVVVLFEHAADVEGVLVLANHHRTDAFDEPDLSLIGHLKEDILAAFHKTRLLRDLHSLSERKSEVIRMAAHDFRSPVATIVSHLEAMCKRLEEDRLEPEKALRRLHMLGQLGHQSIALLERLLDLSTIENQAAELELREIDLERLLEDCVTRYREPAHAKSITLEMADRPHLPPIIADPLRITQVLDNLLSNAIKYTEPGGRVELRASLRSSSVVVSVSDTGQGLSEDDKHEVFHSFKRLSAQPTGGEHSTGLGLVIARTIVERHQGRIWVDSEQNRGSTFHFSLPVQTQ